MISKRDKKKIRIRKKVVGTCERPRLCVFRSNVQIYAQLIDDSQDKTIAAVSSLTKEIADTLSKANSKIEKSAIVGEEIGKKAIELGIKEVVFDRAGYLYHGRVKAVAEGARKAGLIF